MMERSAQVTTSDSISRPAEAAEKQRAWCVRLASLRGELLGPVYGLLDLSDALHEDARRHSDSPEDFLLSLERICESVQGLLRLAERKLDPANGASTALELDAQFHHDMRSYLARIIGYCELWCEDAEGTFVNEFVDDLRQIHQIAMRLVEQIHDLLNLQKLTEAGGAGALEQKYARPEVNGIPPSLDDSSAAATAITGIILVVDDNDINRDVLRRRLDREGHRVAVAADGLDALQLIRSQPFDLVLLDLMMPGLSGWQVLAQLKADHRYCCLPVIMISALNEIHSVVRCIEMGADDYLIRPVNPVLLRARINSCLEKKRLRDLEQSYLDLIKRAEKQADDLLHAVFPEPIVKGLRGEARPRPRRHENVAVLFADIVNFTRYCDEREPEEVVRYLDAAVGSWEGIALEHGVQKIKTIGDAFMAASGLLDTVDNPVLSCVRCGLDMIEAVRRLPPQWDLRVGIHFGPVVAGVIGSRQYLYDLWGDTVNTAARMESHGVSGSITLSMPAWSRVAHICEGSEHVVNVKGKPKPLHTMRFTGFRNRTRSDIPDPSTC
ncbi:MAG TPA: adenylate/guanylate cyclase domain-containing protein [Gemmataceae bacterium]|jgi:adenylate cyclase|nr:adenylate/guanylate cyclase domain-containing protein [Gemmataceae bacterium]